MAPLQVTSINCLGMSRRGGQALELGPGRFDSEGARNYASEKFGGHSLGKFFVDTPPGLASKYT